MAEYFIGDDYYSETSSVKEKEIPQNQDMLIDKKNIHAKDNRRHCVNRGVGSIYIR